jgi:aspartyl aminopeptidase
LPGLNESLTHFHAVNHSKKRLNEAGFQEIKERDDWSIKPGQGYYLTRNNSTIVAFNIPQHTQ